MSQLVCREASRAALCEIHPTASERGVLPEIRQARTLPQTGPGWACEHRYDGGERGCGELLINLALFLRPLPPGVLVHVTARDEAAPLEIPAWCRLTGHELVEAVHPHYLIRRRSPYVSVTLCRESGDRAMVGFVVANAAIASDKDTVVFLSTDGIWAAAQGEAEKINQGAPFAPLKELVDKFLAAGGRMYVCTPCMKKRTV